ncbi:MAG: rhomboid family intramembrane serine protease [Ilumatobacter sp.]|nr:MAG: rhomboid family intramembrane serine protease [Ilumatobacter sp.]
MWAVELIDLVTPGSLDRFGIRPRQLDGLVGIVTAPFLHEGFVHLLTNTVPFVLLGGAIALSGPRVFGTVTVVVAVVGGAGSWLFGAAGTVHVGASALVFGYVTYLIARGFFARRVTYVLGGFVVVVLYGGVLWGVVPRPGISWQGHLFGAIGGVVAAAVVHTDRDATTSARTIDPAAPRPRRWYEPPELP